MFGVVEFTDSKTVAVIPVSWFVGSGEETCYWPEGNASKAAKLVQNGNTPDTSWKKYKIRVLGRAG